MKLTLIAAVVVIAAMPVCSYAQKAAKVTKADAQRVVTMISGDKAKTKIYCDISKLGEQIDQADEKKDSKTVDALSEKMDTMAKQLGPEYAALMDGVQALKPKSKEAKEIGDLLDGLDKLCGK